MKSFNRLQSTMKTHRHPFVQEFQSAVRPRSADFSPQEATKFESAPPAQSPAKLERSCGINPALVRLQRRLPSGVKVLVRPKNHRPVTKGYCVVATRGGELPEVNCQSVTWKCVNT